MAERQWTGAQRRAIEDEGGALLVSAAAGSGKTAVLVERAVRLMCGAEPVDADRLLILTFTNAAAEELRGRIAARLEAAIRTANSPLLQRQRLLLRRAFIGTIDAFCLQLVREHFAQLELPPDIALPDEALLATLQQQAADEAMEEMLQDEDFARFAALYGRARSDAAAQGTLLELYHYTRSMPRPEGHLERFAQMYKAEVPLEDTDWGVVLLGQARAAVAAAGRICEGNLRLAEAAGLEAYLPMLQDDAEQVEALAKALEAGWDEAVQVLARVRLQALRAARNADEAAKEAVKQGRQRVKDIVAELGRKQLACTRAEFEQDREAARPMVEALVRGVGLFADLFYKAKLAERVLDFADFEHLALRLLQNEDGSRTELARRVSGRYHTVMVDEYQDTNALQSALYESLAAPEGDNLFYVGDIKQSIYRFRHANPGIFLAKKQAWGAAGPGQHPAVVHLGHNFRSCPAVIDGVNYLFDSLMSPMLGEVLYDENERLIAGRGEADTAAPGGFELCVVQGTGQDEAAYVAGRIAQMVAQGAPVAEGDDARPCRYDDFCVMMRVKKNMPAVLAALEAAGVPAVADLADSLLETPEVLPLVAALCAIDNPGDDVNMAALLLGPLFHFSADEVTRLRAQNPRGRLWVALVESGDEKAAAFVREMRLYRTLATQASAGRLCEELVARTGYLSAVAAMEDGSARRENLQRFMGWAAQVSSTGRGGLGGFVRLLAGGVGPQPPAVKTVPGHVSVLTVHKSKGLEFPFCFLMDTAHRFNNRSQIGRVALHEQLGVGMALRSGSALYPTLPLLAIRAATAAEERSEELRALYVALTRAKQRMVVSFAEGDPARLLAKSMAELDGARPDPWQLGRAGSFAQWLLAALLRHPDAAPLYEYAGGYAGPTAPREGRFIMRVVQPQQAEAREKAAFTLTARPDEEMVERLQAGFDRRPARLALAGLAAKRSVSSLAKATGQGLAKRPSFMYSAGLSAAEKGTAQHSFMQFAGYEAAAQDLGAELERLWRQGYMDKAMADAVDRAGVHAFLASALYGRVRAARQVMREYDFITALPAGQLQPNLPEALAEEPVLVQGIADLVLVGDEGVEIVDYKTDRGVDAATLAERYRTQLALYRQALEKRLGLPVVRLTIWAFALNEEIEVKV